MSTSPDRPSLRVAASQFPVTGDVRQNVAHVTALMERAARQNADVVHFPESALCGYAPRHGCCTPEELAEATDEVLQLARSLGIWVVLGTEHRGDGPLPFNRTLVVSREGRVAGTYDKRRLYGKELQHYTPGEGTLVVNVDGVRCGFLICFENCFPSLYVRYRELGVSVVFHSFFNAGNTAPTSIAELMRATMLVRAADNAVHVSAANSSEAYSPLPSGIIRPDGVSTWAQRHTTGIVVDEVPAPDLGWTYAPE